jgi:Na+-translocating ferredoxin:NAD+ oxidoreductase RnfA subunit
MVPTPYRAMGIYLPLITTNCASGGGLPGIDYQYDFLEPWSIRSRLVGICLRLVLFAYIRERMAPARCRNGSRATRSPSSPPR